MRTDRIGKARGLSKHLLLAFFLPVILLIACSPPPESIPKPPLRVGIPPDEHPDLMRKEFRPLMAYLEDQIGREIQLVVAENYTSLLRDFGEHGIDMAYFGGVTFLKAAASYGGVPLVMRDIDRNFQSVMIVRGDSPFRRLEDLKGESLGFSDIVSTSGHLMPRMFLQDLGLVPESFFSDIRYTGAHDATVFAVRDGEISVGALNAAVLADMVGDGRIEEDAVRIIWASPPFANYVWVVQTDMSEVTRLELLKAFIWLSKEDPRHREILRAQGASYFLPATRADFSLLEKMLTKDKIRPGIEGQE